ncbi:MAG: hypothetical protein US42_C0008G0029 [Candidatus Magasanikbacteria bacterium GW2011_GWC2_37_14]|uniref:Uncharacterized protein n=1 Tax=Candidatus Magasanikbacteria bacterium GW2011_GWC2_37_14 TaxID=1619046 RepID=A0A0G0G8U0_9BACT|nr:MAG: hypothetical protein US42_C0008G0029 [Candidatus Magasanikbacteria bacterium GW2011_GWC2_37_14]
MNIKLYLKENIIKNFLIILLAGLAFPFFSKKLGGVEPNQMNDLLLILSMLLVTASFANFAFTFEKTKMQKTGQRWLSYFATFIYMLLFALILEALMIAVEIVYPSLNSIIILFTVLLYIGLVFYDFWDLERASQ